MAALIFFAAGCAQEPAFKKSTDGAEYKIFPNAGGKKAVAGNFMLLKL